MKIAIMAGRGQSDTAVAQAFKHAGHEVTLVVYDSSWALQHVDFKTVCVDVSSIEQLTQALTGTEAAYISLAGFDEQECQEVIHQGTKNIVAAAKNCGVKTLGFLSGCNVNEKNSRENYEVLAQYQAELIIKNSGLNYFIFCPSWFMEALPVFIRKGKGYLFANSQKLIHWLAVEDYACMVVKTFGDARLHGSRIMLRGREPFTLEQALKRYINHAHQHEELTIMPVYLAWVMVSFSGKKSLRHRAEGCRYFERVGEEKNNGLSNELLPAPRFTLQAWCQLNKTREHRQGEFA